MKRTFTTFGMVFIAVGTAVGQVASHAPTVFSQPAPGSSPTMVSMTAVGKTVARVNGSVLTDADLVREEYSIFPYARQHNGLPKELAPQIRDGALKMIIFEELVYQEALRRKMTVGPAKMAQAETEFKKQFATPEEFNALLNSEFHGSMDQLRVKIRRSLLIEAMLKQEIDEKSAVSVAEVRAYYDKNAARFARPESYIFQTISVLPPEKATAAQLQEARKRAEDDLRQAKATKSAQEFGLLAEKISDDDYRVMMGQHKAIPVGELAPQVLKALSTMKPDDTSDLIPMDQAYTIVHLNEHVPAGKLKFEDTKVQLTKEVQERKTNQLRAELDKKLRHNAKIEEM